jgi:GTP-binding protein HflX
VESHDRLFETLDATTRILALGSGYNATLTDTVGFVRKLPHSLVESFRATLAEVAAAHLLLHVVDAVSPAGEARQVAVKEVLREIGAAQIPEIVIYNKIDLLDADAREGFVRRASAEGDAIAMSARTGEGAGLLREMIRERIRASWIEVQGEIPGEESELLAKLTRVADVRDVEPNGSAIRVRALVSPGEWARLASRYASRAPELFGRTRGTPRRG